MQGFVLNAAPPDRSPGIVGQRPSNALIKDVRAIFSTTPGEAAVLSVFKGLMGGLWVGGTTYLTGDAITFLPNELNISHHEGDCSLSLALRDVTGIRQRFGFISQIIDIRTSDDILTFRCFGARSFVEAIETQVARQRRVTAFAPPADIAGGRPRKSSHANPQIFRY